MEIKVSFHRHSHTHNLNKNNESEGEKKKKVVLKQLVLNGIRENMHTTQCDAKAPTLTKIDRQPRELRRE